MIAINYLKGSFIIDFIAGLPLEYFTHKDIAEQSVIDPKFQGLLKLGRLLRINRIIRYLNTKKDYKAGAQLLNIILFLIIYLHFYACMLWIMVH